MYIQSLLRPWSACLSARKLLTVSFVAIVCLLGSRPAAQTGTPPNFDPIGLQPGRAYFSQLPFESIDTISGGVILKFTDLVLPGDAGMDVRIIRSYNHQAVGPQWTFGFDGVPMRVERPDGTPNECCSHPVLVMADGSRRSLFPVNTVYNDTEFITEDFWRYTTTSRTLELPNGWTATYEEGNFVGGAMLAELHDVYGNSVVPDWQGGAPGDIRPLRLDGVAQTVSGTTRTVTFAHETAACGMMPSKMTYLGREWAYGCEYEDPDQQSGWRITAVTPSVGPGWTFEYDDGLDGALTVTTPSGGVVSYDFDDVILPATESTHRSVLGTRTVSGRGITSATWMFSFGQSSGQATATIDLPDGRQIEFVHAWLGGKWVLDRKVLKTAGAHAVAARFDRTYEMLPITPNFPNAPIPVPKDDTITQDGDTYTTKREYRSSNLGDYHRPSVVTEEGDLTRVTAYEYDYNFTPYLLNRVAKETVTVNQKSFETSFAYEDATGFLSSQTIYGVSTTFGRDARGNRSRSTDANDRATSYSFENGTLKTTTTPKFTVPRHINADGTVAWEEHSGRRTTFEYDDLGRLTKVTPPDAAPGVALAASLTEYDNQAGAWIKTTRGANVTTTYLDGFGRPTGSLTSAGVRTTIRYDSDGRVSYEGYPFSVTDRGDALEYDPLGRLAKRTHSDSTFVTFAHSGSHLTITDEEGRSTTQVWGAFGTPSDAWLLGLVDADNKTWTYDYNAVGSLTKVRAPDNSIREWHYDAKNQLDFETHPESGMTTYTRDNVGNLETKTDALGRTFLYTFDGNNRLTDVDAPGTAHDVHIDFVGENRTGVSNGFVGTGYSYDGANRIAARTDTIAGHVFVTSFGYDALDNLTLITYPNQRQVAYDIEAANGTRVKKVYEPSGTVFADQIAYHPSGAVAGFLAGNGQIESITFDHRGRPDGLQSGPLQLDYDPDGVGNITKITDSRSAFTQTFGYDALDRLSAVYGSFGATTFTYDAQGNRRTKGDVTYNYSPQTHRLDSTTGGNEAASYGYDLVGNLETAPSTVMSYTPFNMLETFTVTNVSTQVTSTTTYRYDGENMRAIRLPGSGAMELMLHGADGQLLAEYAVPATTPVWRRDYVYLGARLLASVEAPDAAPTPAAPTVTVAPSSVERRVGQTATFTAAATGVPSPSVQWQQSTDGTAWIAITGATSTSYSRTVTIGDHGRWFRAVFTNASGTATTTTARLTVALPPTDLDGDGKGDLIVWRASTGTWYWLLSSTNYQYAGSQQWGNESLGDVPLLGDFDGDGISDLALWRASTGTWYWLASSTNYVYGNSRQWGNQSFGDKPMAADFDGDGKSDLCLWRASEGRWYWLTSSTNYDYAQQRAEYWGNQSLGDIPFLTDIDGDRRPDLTVWRATDGYWYWKTSTSNYVYANSKQWGNSSAGDVPNVGDFDGDARTDLAVYRASEGRWYWLISSTGYNYLNQQAEYWGATQGDTPLLPDIDGDGLADLAVWRASDGTWYWKTSSSGYATAHGQQWGNSSLGDVPIVR